MPPDTPVGDGFADVLETSRRFLLAIANAELTSDLQAKVGASDVVQEALTAAHRSRHQFRGRTLADLNGWLRSILLNELATHRRRFATAARDVGRESPLDPDAIPAAADLYPPAQLELAERDRTIAAAVGRLPDDTRVVLALRLEDGLGFAAIGERLGRSEEAVRKLFTRALDRLRELLSAKPDW